MSELTDSEVNALLRVWLDNDVNRGIEWLLPTVDRLVREKAERAWSEGWCAGASNTFAMNGEKPLPQGNPYAPTDSGRDGTAT